jgi:hypothetical protein
VADRDADGGDDCTDTAGARKGEEHPGHCPVAEAVAGDRDEVPALGRDGATLRAPAPAVPEAGLLHEELAGLVTDTTVPSAQTLEAAYHVALDHLIDAFDPGAYPHGPHEVLRSMIERITLTPNEDRTELRAELHGSFAGVLAMIGERQEAETPQPASKETGCEPTVVAGAGFEPATFRL